MERTVRFTSSSCVGSIFGISWEGLVSGGRVIFPQGFSILALCLWEVMDFTSVFLSGQIFRVLFALLHMINNGPNG